MGKREVRGGEVGSGEEGDRDVVKRHYLKV